MSTTVSSRCIQSTHFPSCVQLAFGLLNQRILIYFVHVTKPSGCFILCANISQVSFRHIVRRPVQRQRLSQKQIYASIGIKTVDENLFVYSPHAFNTYQLIARRSPYAVVQKVHSIYCLLDYI